MEPSFLCVTGPLTHVRVPLGTLGGSTQQPDAITTIIVPILQMGKVTFRKLGNLHKVTELLGRQVRGGTYEV